MRVLSCAAGHDGAQRNGLTTVLPTLLSATHMVTRPADLVSLNGWPRKSVVKAGESKLERPLRPRGNPAHLNRQALTRSAPVIPLQVKNFNRYVRRLFLSAKKLGVVSEKQLQNFEQYKARLDKRHHSAIDKALARFRAALEYDDKRKLHVVPVACRLGVEKIPYSDLYMPKILERKPPVVQQVAPNIVFNTLFQGSFRQFRGMYRDFREDTSTMRKRFSGYQSEEKPISIQKPIINQKPILTQKKTDIAPPQVSATDAKAVSYPPPRINEGLAVRIENYADRLTRLYRSLDSLLQSTKMTPFEKSCFEGLINMTSSFIENIGRLRAKAVELSSTTWCDGAILSRIVSGIQSTCISNCNGADEILYRMRCMIEELKTRKLNSDDIKQLKMAFHTCGVAKDITKCILEALRDYELEMVGPEYILAFLEKNAVNPHFGDLSAFSGILASTLRDQWIDGVENFNERMRKSEEAASEAANHFPVKHPRLSDGLYELSITFGDYMPVSWEILMCQLNMHGTEIENLISQVKADKDDILAPIISELADYYQSISTAAEKYHAFHKRPLNHIYEEGEEDLSVEHLCQLWNLNILLQSVISDFQPNCRNQNGFIFGVTSCLKSLVAKEGYKLEISKLHPVINRVMLAYENIVEEEPSKKNQHVERCLSSLVRFGDVHKTALTCLRPDVTPEDLAAHYLFLTKQILIFTCHQLDSGLIEKNTESELTELDENFKKFEDLFRFDLPDHRDNTEVVEPTGNVTGSTIPTPPPLPSPDQKKYYLDRLREECYLSAAKLHHVHKIEEMLRSISEMENPLSPRFPSLSVVKFVKDSLSTFLNNLESWHFQFKNCEEYALSFTAGCENRLELINVVRLMYINRLKTNVLQLVDMIEGNQPIDEEALARMAEHPAGTDVISLPKIISWVNGEARTERHAMPELHSEDFKNLILEDIESSTSKKAVKRMMARMENAAHLIDEYCQDPTTPQQLSDQQAAIKTVLGYTNQCWTDGTQIPMKCAEQIIRALRYKLDVPESEFKASIYEDDLYVKLAAYVVDLALCETISSSSAAPLADQSVQSLADTCESELKKRIAAVGDHLAERLGRELAASNDVVRASAFSRCLTFILHTETPIQIWPRIFTSLWKGLKMDNVVARESNAVELDMSKEHADFLEILSLPNSKIDPLYYSAHLPDIIDLWVEILQTSFVLADDIVTHSDRMNLDIANIDSLALITQAEGKDAKATTPFATPITLLANR